MNGIGQRNLWACVLLGLLLALGASSLLGAADRETRWAYVENQTNSTIALRFDEVVAGGHRATTGVRVYAGENKKLDATTIQGEVCAWGAQEYKPAEQIGCRTLRPGDHWVIH